MRTLIAAAALLALAGCPQYGMFDDGTSVSYGSGNHGRLVSAVRLPRAGDGYWIPPRWAARGSNFGTDEMIRFVIHLGRQMSRAYPGSKLGVADISPLRGGRSRWHRTHQIGKDVDLLFFAVDRRGRPVRSDSMLHFSADGQAKFRTAQGSERAVYFDVERNWHLIKSAIENPVARVQYIFVFDPLKQMLLDYATAIDEPPDVVQQASYLLHQPSDSACHDDHFHVRLYCSRADRMVGCRDRGPLRWTKKDRKYRDRPRVSAMPAAAWELLVDKRPAMLSLTSLPFRGGAVR